MKWDRKEYLCRTSYWALFIVAPTAAVIFIGSWAHPRIGWALPVFIVLILIGEHLYRQWKKLWHLDGEPETPGQEMKDGPNKAPEDTVRKLADPQR